MASKWRAGKSRSNITRCLNGFVCVVPLGLLRGTLGSKDGHTVDWEWRLVQLVLMAKCVYEIGCVAQM